MGRIIGCLHLVVEMLSVVPVVVGADESLELVEKVEGVGIRGKLDSYFCICKYSYQCIALQTWIIAYCSRNLVGHRYSWRSSAGGDDCANAHFLKY